MNIGVFYGSTTGNTQEAAEKIQARLAERVPNIHDVKTAEPARLEHYDLILFGVPTWNVGEMRSSRKPASPTSRRPPETAAARWFDVMAKQHQEEP